MIPTPEASIVRDHLPPHVRRVRNRTGREYLIFQKHRGTSRASGPQRLPDNPSSPEFWNAYAVACGLPPPRVNPQSFRALDTAWEASPEWQALSPGTKREWSRHRRRILEAWGELEVRGLQPKHVLGLRDGYADRPATANNMLRCLSSMLGWSVPRDWRPDNPCREVPPLKGGEAYAPWPWEVIQAAERDLKAKGREDLWWAVALALYTGQRLGDCLAMKWSAISGGTIWVKQGKTGKELTIPVHKTLGAVLEAVPRRAVNVLTSSAGTPWRGFQASWARFRPQAVAEAGLVFHGLRKSAVVTLLEAGCSEAETAAVTGQSLAMVAHYARGVNQGKLAASAVLKWERAT